MAKGYPSMIALLGLIAVAGYQHRDKLAEMFGSRDPNDPDRGKRNAEWDRVLADVKKAGAGVGGLLNSGLSELLERFKQGGREDVAQSWVNRGPNRDVTPEELEAVIGADMLAELSLRTGLSHQEVLARLAQQLPDAVDRYTPDGRLPTA